MQELFDNAMERIYVASHYYRLWTPDTDEVVSLMVALGGVDRAEAKAWVLDNSSFFDDEQQTDDNYFF